MVFTLSTIECTHFQHTCDLNISHICWNNRHLVTPLAYSSISWMMDWNAPMWLGEVPLPRWHVFFSSAVKFVFGLCQRWETMRGHGPQIQVFMRRSLWVRKLRLFLGFRFLMYLFFHMKFISSWKLIQLAPTINKRIMKTPTHNAQFGGDFFCFTREDKYTLRFTFTIGDITWVVYNPYRARQLESVTPNTISSPHNIYWMPRTIWRYIMLHLCHHRW